MISEISGKRLGATAVMDDNENLKGIITDGDLRRMMERTDDFVYIQAGDIMSGFPKTISIDNLAVDAFAMMKNIASLNLWSWKKTGIKVWCISMT